MSICCALCMCVFYTIDGLSLELRGTKLNWWGTQNNKREQSGAPQINVCGNMFIHVCVCVNIIHDDDDNVCVCVCVSVFVLGVLSHFLYTDYLSSQNSIVVMECLKDPDER